MTSADSTYRRPRAAPPSSRTIVRLRALDIDAAPAQRERLIDVLHRGTGLLVLDLSHVLSCDALLLAVLISTQRRARLLGTRLRLAAPSSPVTQFMRSTGLDRSFTIYPDLGSALASEPAGNSLPELVRSELPSALPGLTGFFAPPSPGALARHFPQRPALFAKSLKFQRGQFRTSRCAGPRAPPGLSRPTGRPHADLRKCGRPPRWQAPSVPPGTGTAPYLPATAVGGGQPHPWPRSAGQAWSPRPRAAVTSGLAAARLASGGPGSGG